MQDSDSSGELVDRAADGDDDALAALFSRCHVRLRRIIDLRMDPRLRARIDASDILQDVKIVAAKNISKYAAHPANSFFIWMRHLTTHRLIDIHRRHLGAKMRTARNEVQGNRPVWGQGSSVTLARMLVGQLSTPSAGVVRAELLDHVQAALDALHPMDREVIALRHFEELTNKEVAELLNLRRSAASNRYVRALTRLRAILSKVSGFFDETELS